ncbi:MAG: hypothetical protein ACRDR6_17130 [Pseudonocardiaceae bacterium]
MNARAVILTIGAVMVTAGGLIELAGYAGDHTAAGEASYTPRPPAGGAGTSEYAPLPAPVTTTRPQAGADDPYLAVHYLYRAIANGSATGCALLSPTAAQQFAADFDAPDCPAATNQLNAQVTSPIKYAVTGTRSPDVYLGDTMTISSCEIKPEGGPSLGRFTLQRTGQDKWYISGNEKETC